MIQTHEPNEKKDIAHSVRRCRQGPPILMGYSDITACKELPLWRDVKWAISLGLAYGRSRRCLFNSLITNRYHQQVLFCSIPNLVDIMRTWWGMDILQGVGK